MKAKSKRNRARLSFIQRNAAQPVIDALNAGELSIFYAEQIAHAPTEKQSALLEDISKVIKKRKPLPDAKMVAFPGANWPLEAWKENEGAIAKLETEAIQKGIRFNKFQREFAVEWRRLVKRHIKEHSYLQMWEWAEMMVGRVSASFPDEKAS